MFTRRRGSSSSGVKLNMEMTDYYDKSRGDPITRSTTNEDQVSRETHNFSRTRTNITG